MGLFSHNVPLIEIFQGYTDCHCHLLPGVDDGVRSMETSLAMLSEAAQLGVAHVWLTSHVMEDCPNTPDGLRERFEELKQAIAQAGIQTPQLHLSAENMMDELFESRLEQGIVLPHLARHLLVETSYYNPPFDLYGILSKVKSKGYFPILAHPERYVYMDDAEYRRLKDMGIRFQLNLSSLAGFYGKTAQGKAERMLKLGYYDFTGTDLHNRVMLERYKTAKVSSKVMDRLKVLVKPE